MLLYALGHEQRLREVAAGLELDPHELARKWHALEADAPLPDRPTLYNQRKVKLLAKVLGCKVTITSENDAPCVEVAESILAIIESFLATSILTRAFPLEPELTAEVRLSHFAGAVVEATRELRGGRPHVVVHCRRFDPHKLPADEQREVQEAIFKAAITVLASIAYFKDSRRDLEVLFRDERVAERAVAFTTTLKAQANVLGEIPKTRLRLWLDGTTRIYPLLQGEGWSPKEVTSIRPDGLEQATALNSSEPLNTTPQSHQIEVVSLIRQNLWELAGWTGTVFLTDPDHKYLPVFGLVFENRGAGEEIFRQWRSELGDIDKQEQLRLSVLRGIDKARPYAYRVIVGSNLDSRLPDTRYAMLINRIHTIDAGTPENLDRFLKAHAAAGAFDLAPAFAPTGWDGMQVPALGLDLSIAIRHVHVRYAWEVGLNDLESAAIDKEDNPIIPPEIDDPPIRELIRRLAASS